MVTKVVKPTLQVFLPKNANNANSAVIICPGGGYGALAIDHEGYAVADSLNAMGVAAFVLKYRLPDSNCMQHREDVPLMDAQRALQMVRERASEWKVDTAKIGIMGFSAGGHLASSVATHFNEKLLANPNNTSLRPNFAILIYPVISFDTSFTHMGSRNNLIGRKPDAGSVRRFSNELQITPQTPPTFIVHAANDPAVPVENSIRFFQALIANKVAVEMHIYPKGGHGFGMENNTTKDRWMDRLKNWFAMNDLLP